jgi:hypothetical protein
MMTIRRRNVNLPAPRPAIITYYVGSRIPVSGCHPDPAIHSEKRKSGFDAERTRLGQNREKNGSRE